MGIWQTGIVFHSSILMIRGRIATLYREGVDASTFTLSDLALVEGDRTTGIAFLATALIGRAQGAIGLSPDLDASMSLSPSPVQLLLNGSGLWFSVTAISIAYLDSPRRKQLLGIASDRPQVSFIASRRQRRQLLPLLQALRLEEVMQRVGLGAYVGATEHYGTNLPHDHGNGATQ
jgi:hypothetical protein